MQPEELTNEAPSDNTELDAASDFRAACDALNRAADSISLLSSKCGGTSILQSMLESKNTKEVKTALRALHDFDPRQILELILPIYRLTEVSTYYFSAVRLLAILPAKTLRHTLVPLVFDRLMDSDNDYDYYSWRLNALMLEYFGFDDAAQRVAILALASDDPEVREVGAEMIAEMATPGSPPYG